MLKKLKTSYYGAGAALIVGLTTGAETAHATGAGGGNNFSSIAGNIADSIASLPGLLSALAYMFGLLLAVLGIMKIKDHVENPSNTPLKDGAIRLLAGGALFALPIILESMLNTVGADDTGAGVAKVDKVTLGLN